MKTNPTFAAPEQMLDPPALAAMLRISVRYLADVRRDDPTFPAPRKVGTLPRWSPDAIRAWMCAGPTAGSASDTPPVGAPSSSPRRAGAKGRGRVQ